MMRINIIKKKRGLRLAATIAGFVCGQIVLAPATAIAAPWEFGVILDVGVIQTDNVFLEVDGLEESETAYTVSPEFFLTTDGDRLDADFRYRPEAFFYSDNSDADDVFHSLDASLTGTLVRERLFIDLSAVNFQSIITSEGQFPTTNLPISNNRVDSQIYEVRPYWQQRISQADLLVEASYFDVEYDDDLFQSNNQRYGHFQLTNIERQQGLAWGIEYDYRRMEYDNSLPWEFQRATLNLGFWINGSTRIFAAGGAETAFDDIFESDMDESFWEGGIQYRPNQRLNMEVAVGDRSYGTSVRGSLAYTLRRGDVSLTYDEGPATRGDLVFDRGPLTNTDNLDNILDQPGASDRFIRRRGELFANIELSKSELTFRAFAESRDSRTTADGVELDDEELLGAAIRWSWNVGTKTTFGVGVDISERDQSGRKDDLFRAQLDLAYNFSERMSLRLEGMHSEQDGQDTNDFDYKENQLRLLLRTEF